MHAIKRALNRTNEINRMNKEPDEGEPPTGGDKEKY
jgi:hypothetical protein